MKQHTLQEIADFLGCFVAYGRYSSVFSCPREPRYSEDVHGYVTPYAECFLTIPREIISDFSTHDPRVLVRPTKSN